MAAAALLVLLAAGLSPGVATATSCPAIRAGDHALDVDAGTGARRVLVHIPPGGTPAPRPLVLGLAGAGQSPFDFARLTNYSRLADRERFIVVYAAGSGRLPFWNTSGALPGLPDDVAFLAAVLDRVGRLACVDGARVYATGVSNGGGMTALLGCRMAWRLAAIAPVAGGYGTQPPRRPVRPIAVLEVHGAADDVVPYMGRGASHFGGVPQYLSMWRRINRCGARALRLGPTPSFVVELTWGGCATGADVVHDVIEREGHSWPSWTWRRAYSTTWRTWAFFRGHARVPSAPPQITD
jgi:polyhydroxybutyrate depolymerase